MSSKWFKENYKGSCPSCKQPFFYDGNLEFHIKTLDCRPLWFRFKTIMGSLLND